MPIDTNFNMPTSAPPPSGPSGILGTLAGAAPTIGSIVGGIGGTVLGGPLGGITGAGAGGAIGQGVDDLSKGQNPFQANDITSGLEGAGGQALGEGVLGGLGKGLSMLGGSSAVERGSQAVALKFLQDQLSSRVLPSGVDAKAAAQTLLDNGITDITKARSSLGVLTGSADSTDANAGLLNNSKDSIINDMGENGVRVYGPFSQYAQQATDPETNPIASNFNDSTKADQFIDRTLKDAGLLKDAPGGMKGAAAVTIDNSDGADVQKANQAYKTLRAAADQQAGDLNGKATSGAYSYVAEAISKHLLERPEAAVTPEIRQQMLDALDSSGLKGSNPKAYSTGVKAIEGAQNARDLNNSQTELVNALRAAEAPISRNAGTSAAGMIKTAGKIAAPIVGGAVGGLPGAAAGVGIDALGTQGGQAVAAGIANNAPKILSGAGGALASKAGLATGGAVGSGVLGGSLQAAGNQGKGSTLTAATGGNNMQQPNTGGEVQGINPELGTENLLKQMEVTFGADPTAEQAMVPLITQLLQQVRTAHAAGQSLAQYQQTLSQAGSPGGAVGGTLSQIGGALTGGAASQVGPQAATTEALLKAAGVPGVQLPGLMQNQAGQAAGMGQAQSLLGAVGGS